MDTTDMATWIDESIAEIVADTMHEHHDMDVSFADHARHIVAALRDYGLLADAALDVEGVRHMLDALTVHGREAFGDDFHFCTATIWSHKSRGPEGFAVTLHIANTAKAKTFYAEFPAHAFAAAHAWIMANNPRTREAEGWQILGVVRA